jgi:signal transduction histidine kinase
MIQRPLRPEQQREVMETIHRQTALMISIVNELLDLARIEARRGAEFELETLDLCELADEVIRDFKPPGDRRAPRVSPCHARCLVRVDRHKLAQALGNVLSNAYKYSPAGGEVQVGLVFGDTAAGREVGLQVRDQGIGMTAAQLARVSERFYRADASGSIPGTGLGMSIVKEIIELLGGRMALASEPALGTTVTLWLPQVEATEGNLSSFAVLEG